MAYPNHPIDVSIVIPWCNRAELAISLGHNLPCLIPPGAGHSNEILIVCCGGDTQVLIGCVQEALARNPDIDTNNTCLRCLHIEGGEQDGFNKALALNLGAYAARGQRLFFLDTDILLDSACLDRALELARTGCLVTLDRVRESVPPPLGHFEHLAEVVHSIELVTRDGKTVRIETNRRRLDDGSRSAPGLVLILREHFLAVDGMNSDLHGWGWEDLDLLVRVQLMLDVQFGRAGHAVHLSHGDDRRALGGTSRAASEARNFSMCLANYGLGHYLGTYSDDIVTAGDRLRELVIAR